VTAVHTGSDKVESFSMNWTQQYASYTHRTFKLTAAHDHRALAID